LLAAGKYDEVLSTLASLSQPVDRFFEEVMVMCDDPSVRANRLSLLASLGALFMGVADIARLQWG